METWQISPYESNLFTNSCNSQLLCLKLACAPIKLCALGVQSADMHVSAFYPSSVQLGTHLACMNLLSPRHVVQQDDINVSCRHAQSAQTTTREVSFALSLISIRLKILGRR
jgi:hypothetical protein